MAELAPVLRSATFLDDPNPLDTIVRIRERVSEAVVSQAGLNHAGLTAELRRQLGQSSVEAGALVREPVIEAAAPFVSSGRTFADCAGSVLDPQVIQAISAPSAGAYRFPGEAQPYRHQLEAWQHLTAPDPRSVLVSSGTGSGKTECFLMPLLDDLAREAQKAGRLSGVRALALYPLNALIESQKERLSAWTAPFGGKLRFGLYNGLTPETLPAAEHIRPEQVLDRTRLRADPPPILVTNVTMLEYMLVRRQDRPLIENSKGCLRWIILDEAHSYVGSAAAEIALLLRRVLLTFGCKSDNVRFVATSATIGEGKDVTDDLRHFLRDISGSDLRQIHVVSGAREAVTLPARGASGALTDQDLANPEIVARHGVVQDFVRLIERGPVSLPQADTLLQGTGQPATAIMSALTAAAEDGKHPILPLRVHSFLRAMPGLWSCVNAACPQSPPDWPMGAVLAERTQTCPHCEGLVLEIKACRECGEPYLEAEEIDGVLKPRLTPPAIDEFAALREREVADEDDAGDDPVAPTDAAYDGWTWGLAVRELPGGKSRRFDPHTGRLLDRAETGQKMEQVVLLHDITDPAHGACGYCRAEPGKAGAVLRSLRFGAPFLIGNAAPVLLEGIKAKPPIPQATHRPPAGGRQLLSFTDSRQGTARFAASLQTNAERNFIRGLLYHTVQGALAATATADPARVVELETLIATLEAVGNPVLEGTIADKRRELAEALNPPVKGLSWAEMRQRLAEYEDVGHWIRQVWRERDERFNDRSVFAHFMLLREFNRRPRKGNSVETMGLVQLHFPAITAIRTLPEALSGRMIQGRAVTLQDWHSLLHVMLDQVARTRFAFWADRADIHWLHARVQQTTLLPPGKEPDNRYDLRWPMAGRKGLPGNIVLAIAHALGLDHHDDRHRETINAVLEAAWHALYPVLHDPTRGTYALDLEKAELMPVVDAWLCPVTRRVLPHLALGLTPYGQRDGLVQARQTPVPIKFPRLPHRFPDAKERHAVQDWLRDDTDLKTLREQGVWSDLHDRSALLSPYFRAAEHSAQLSSARLRGFEAAFKAGEINVLNCSTTMEMGVDIGSVSAVMMTNVPPGIANYRQRMGRAGRRGQGFATALTFARDMPLDREAFRDPLLYLDRKTFAPRVRLDSRRIVQRHVNALALARWFASAQGEVMRARVGDFFGCPEGLAASCVENSLASAFLGWLSSPVTQAALGQDVATLIKGTALERASHVLDATGEALREVEAQVLTEWHALQAQAIGLPAEARSSIGYQLQRLCRESLLKDLGVRGFLPAHGMPTGVVPFIHKDLLSHKEAEARETSSRYRSYPSRSLDVAIRDYAPGGSVVVDGLVHSCAGVTLNWQRPANDDQVREIQSVKTFWTCTNCGAGDCSRVVPAQCPSCRSDLPLAAQRRFLEPAGFTTDRRQLPHADTDEVQFVESEAEQIVAKGAAWQPLADPLLGRLRASADGLVFHSSRGLHRQGYDICLECGRAAACGPAEGDERPLAGHSPLRLSKDSPATVCTGNDKPFRILRNVALGHEASTDVAEIQSVGLECEGAAWAAVAALREALARRLAIETSELGIGIQRATTPLGQRTYSLMLFDRASGGAGFATQAVALFEHLLPVVESVLDCPEKGCRTGCSACVLTPDLQRRQDMMDRVAALDWVRDLRFRLGTVPEEDRLAPDTRYTRALADEILSLADAGAGPVTVWLPAQTDGAQLDHGILAHLARRLAERGTGLSIVAAPDWLDGLDPAARLALRDVMRDWRANLRRGEAPVHANGARALADAGGQHGRRWMTRDTAAPLPGNSWGQAQEHPVVSIPAQSVPLAPAVTLDSLLPRAGTRFVEIKDQLNGPLSSFGSRFAELVKPLLRDAGATGMGGLVGMEYSDRYIQSPLVVRLLADGLGGLAQILAPDDHEIPLRIYTNPFKRNERQPYALHHDWQHPEDRRENLEELLGRAGFLASIEEHGAAHGRVVVLHFASGKTVRLVLDQGFGAWGLGRHTPFDFGAPAMDQAEALVSIHGSLEERGPSYLVMTL